MQPIKTETSQTRRVTAQEVLDFITDLHYQEQQVTRELLAERIGVRLSVIDEHLKVMTNDGRIRRVGRGVYAPMQSMPPARAMSKTLLPDGYVKIEIGDQVLTLTPREDRMLGNLMGGAANLRTQVDFLQEAEELATNLRQIARAMKMSGG